MVKITIGDYPAEYKPEVHGPYDPGRYYGKRKTHLLKVPFIFIIRFILFYITYTQV